MVNFKSNKKANKADRNGKLSKNTGTADAIFEGLLENDEDDEELTQYRKYVPEWKRDALFEVPLPESKE